MKKIAKSIICVILLFGLMISPLSVVPEATAESQGSLPLGEPMSDWIIDSTQNRIYAVTETGNLKVIDLNTLQILNTISIGGTPTDIKQSGNKLYIAEPSSSSIVEVDITTEAKVLYTVSTAPYTIAVNGNQLFYAEGDQHCDVFVYDLSDGTDTKITGLDKLGFTVYEPDLTIDPATNTLYIAESGSSGSSIFAVSTANFSLLSESTFDDGYGFPYPLKTVINNNGDIFYAGRMLDSSNLANIYGTYYEDVESLNASDIVAVSDNFVFTKNEIFDRHTFLEVDILPFETNQILAQSDNLIYMYNQDTNTIQKELINPSTDLTDSSIISNNKLANLPPLDDWVIDEANKRIYAISKIKNELLYINSDTLTIEMIKKIGSAPSDIELVNNKLYISNMGGTNIAVVDITLDTVDFILTLQNPYKITTDGTDLYYVTEDQWGYIYNVNLNTNTDRKIEVDGTNMDMYYEPDIELDSANDILFVGESGSSGSILYKVNPVDGTILSQSKDGGYSYPSREVIMDGDNVYFAEYRLSAANISDEIGTYSEEILYAKDNLVVTENGIYNRDTFAKLYTSPCPIKLFSVNSDTQIFMYLPEENAIYRYNTLGNLTDPQVVNLQGSPESSNVFQLSWDTATGDGYYVYYKTSEMASFQKLNDVVDTNNFLRILTPNSWLGHTVTFGVKAAQCGMESSLMSATIDYTFEIPVPSNMNGQFSGDKFEITWDAKEFIEGYNLYYYETDSQVKTKLNSQLLTLKSYTINRDIYESWKDKTITFVATSTINGKESGVSEAFTYTFDQLPVTEEPANNDSTPTTEVPTNNTGDSSNNNEESTKVDQEIIVGNDALTIENNTVKVVESKIEQLINSNENISELSVDLTGNINKVIYPANIIDLMNNKNNDSTIKVETSNAIYLLPTKQINFTALVNKLGVESVDDLDLAIEVYVTEDNRDILGENNLTSKSRIIEFNVTISAGDKTIELNRFNTYVKRQIEANGMINPNNAAVIRITDYGYVVVPAVFYNNRALFQSLTNSKYVIVENNKTFTDVNNGENWAESYIEKLASKLIINGKTDSLYDPKSEITRAEFAALISRGLGLVSTKDNHHKFKDVSGTFQEAISAAFEAGIIKGKTANSFTPNEKLTRAEAAVIVARAMDFANFDETKLDKTKNLNSFADYSSIPSWSHAEIEKVVEAGIIGGKPNGDFAPNEYTKRDQMAKILADFLTFIEFMN